MKRRSVPYRWQPLMGALNRLASTVRQAAGRQFLPWDDWEVEALRELYPHFTNRELATAFGRTRGAVKVKGGSKGLGLKKTAQTWVRAREEAAEGSAVTRFKPGARPQTWQPVGTISDDGDGYLKKKISDRRDVPSRHNWKYLHVLAWEQHNGPVPAGHNVVFRNGNKHDIRIENLQLLSDADLMRRNTRHRYPEEINRLLSAKAALTRKINSRSKETHGQRR